MMRRFAILLLAFVLLGCGTTQKTVFEGPPNSDAEAAYRAAVKTLEGGSNDEAIRAFSALKLQFPYATRWSTLAELRIADAHRNSGDCATAAVSYQDFVRTFPAHAEVPYATYQAANCYYQLMPSNIFFLPQPWQRDRRTTQQAEAALRAFIRKFPNDVNIDAARTQYREVRRRLSNHELYVAEFYFKRKAYEGSARRLADLIQAYPDSDAAPQAHILLAHSRLKLNQPVEAKRVLIALTQAHPDSPFARDAQRWIDRNPNVPSQSDSTSVREQPRKPRTKPANTSFSGFDD